MNITHLCFHSLKIGAVNSLFTRKPVFWLIDRVAFSTRPLVPFFSNYLGYTKFVCSSLVLIGRTSIVAEGTNANSGFCFAISMASSMSSASM